MILWVLGGMIVFLLIFFGLLTLKLVRSQLTVHPDNTISYRSIFWTKRISLAGYEGALLLFSHAGPMNGGSTASIVVRHKATKHRFMKLPEGFWSLEDLFKVAERLELPLYTRDIGEPIVGMPEAVKYIPYNDLLLWQSGRFNAWATIHPFQFVFFVCIPALAVIVTPLTVLITQAAQTDVESIVVERRKVAQQLLPIAKTVQGSNDAVVGFEEGFNLSQVNTREKVIKQMSELQVILFVDNDDPETVAVPLKSIATKHDLCTDNVRSLFVSVVVGDGPEKFTDVVARSQEKRSGSFDYNRNLRADYATALVDLDAALPIAFGDSYNTSKYQQTLFLNCRS